MTGIGFSLPNMLMNPDFDDTVRFGDDRMKREALAVSHTDTILSDADTAGVQGNDLNNGFPEDRNHSSNLYQIRDLLKGRE